MHAPGLKLTSGLASDYNITISFIFNLYEYLIVLNETQLLNFTGRYVWAT